MQYRRRSDRLGTVPTGLTAAEMIAQVTPLLPSALWPGGQKVDWWQQTVKLDLEAKGVLRRDAASKPLRWYRAQRTAGK